jgi:hypothetical protein
MKTNQYLRGRCSRTLVLMLASQYVRSIFADVACLLMLRVSLYLTELAQYARLPSMGSARRGNLPTDIGPDYASRRFVNVVSQI